MSELLSEAQYPHFTVKLKRAIIFMGNVVGGIDSGSSEK